MRTSTDNCGCFPTGRHYAGIAHLLRAIVRGLVEDLAQDGAWRDHPIALIDVETTGRDSSTDRVIEVGIALGRGGVVVARYNWLINPGGPISPESTAVHGIKDEDVKDSPSFAEIAHEIAQALAGTIPAAYNAGFDRAFMLAEFGRTGHAFPKNAALTQGTEWIDPLVWARELQREEKSRALGDVAQRLGVALENAHRASEDAEAALLVLYKLGEDARIPTSYGGLVQEQRRLGLAQADERRFWKS